jgi:hypothetical protein
MNNRKRDYFNNGIEEVVGSIPSGSTSCLARHVAVAGAGEKMSKHGVPAGDVAALVAALCRTQAQGSGSHRRLLPDRHHRGGRTRRLLAASPAGGRRRREPRGRSGVDRRASASAQRQNRPARRGGAEIPPRRQRRRAHLRRIVRLAHLRHEGREARLAKQILKPIIERMPRRTRHLSPRRHQFALNPVRSPHRHR